MKLLVKKVTFHVKSSKNKELKICIMFWRVCLISFLFICQGYLVAQETSEKFLEVRGLSELDMEPLINTTVNLYEGSTKVKTIKTGLDGTFTFKLNINKQYTIELEKDGLISKRISFNTSMPEDEKGTWMNEFSMSLIKPCAGVDYSLLKQPVDQVKFDPKRREFLSDKDYVNNMRPKMEALMIKTDQCLLEKYESLVTKANQNAEQKKFEEAINLYREALQVFPKEEYPAKRIAELNNQINKQQFAEEAYKKMISEADALIAQGKTNEALQRYKQASTLNPSDAYPKQKISEIEKKLAEQQAVRNAELSKEEKYNQAMAKASVAYTRKDYATAGQFYQEALAIKPGESLPKSRVEEIKNILDKKAAEDAARVAEANKKAEEAKQYQDIIAQADALFKEKKYEEAKAAYAKAMDMRPAESYPAQRVKAIQNAMANEQAAIQKSKDASYTAAMAEANNALAKNQFPVAREYFQKALTIKPDDALAKSRLAEVDKLAEAYAKQKSVDEQYALNVQTGDAHMAKKQYTDAKESYVKAIALKPGDKYAASKITAVENLIAAEQQATLKLQNDNFNKLIAEGNNALAQNQFQQAKDAYRKALTVKPEDAVARKKLTDADRLEEAYNRQKSVDEQYNVHIANGDALVAKKQYTDAKESYVKAIALKPGDKNASTKITAVENLIAAEQQAALKLQNDNFDRFMAEGNNALAQNQFQQAKDAYRKALTVKPEDAVAKKKLADVDKLEDAYNRQKSVNEQYNVHLADGDGLMTKKQYAEARESYTKALGLKPGDKVASSKISAADNAIAAEQTAKLKAVEDGYKAAIGAANTSITQKAYPQAKEQLQKALTFKPGDNYALTRVAEVDRLMEEQQKQLERDKQLTRQYNEMIASADKMMNDKDYNGAKAGYSKVLQMKPGDPYASQKLTTVENLIAAQLELKRKQTEEAYSKAMLAGTNSITAKNYTAAKESFTEALSIKPGDNNAKLKLNETELLIKQDEERKLAEQTRKKKFDDLIKSADQLFGMKNYTGARSAYESALLVVPADPYARQKLDEVIKAIEEQERILASNRAKENAYNQAMVNADKYFQANDLAQSRSEYARAATIKPEEALPKSKLAQIDKMIADKEKAQADAKARLDAYTASMNSGNSLLSKKDYVNARNAYTEALRYMPGDVLASDQIKKIDYLIAEAEKMRKNAEAKQAAYQALISSGDKAFDGARYALAKEEYKKALEIDPTSTYAKQKIARIDEINKLLAQSSTKSTVQNQETPVTAKRVAAIAMKELNFKNESERQKYLDELREKYPAGITLEKYIEQYKETYRYIVVRETVQEFRHIIFKTYNGFQYSMNGKPVTQQYFQSQTKPRQGESFNEIDMQ